MNIAVSNKKGLAQVALEGEINIYNAAALKAPLLDALEKCKKMDITLSNVSEMDSAGFQLLLLVKRESVNQGKPMRLIDHSNATLEILDLYNMAGYFGDPVVMGREK